MLPHLPSALTKREVTSNASRFLTTAPSGTSSKYTSSVYSGTSLPASLDDHAGPHAASTLSSAAGSEGGPPSRVVAHPLSTTIATRATSVFITVISCV